MHISKKRTFLSYFYFETYMNYFFVNFCQHSPSDYAHPFYETTKHWSLSCDTGISATSQKIAQQEEKFFSGTNEYQHLQGFFAFAPHQ